MGVVRGVEGCPDDEPGGLSEHSLAISLRIMMLTINHVILQLLATTIGNNNLQHSTR